MVPTLALGIPGSGTTAMILGVMIMVGLRPGPMLFEQQPHFLGALFAGLLMSNIVFLVIGIFMARWLARISLVDDSRSEEHTSELQSLMRISYAVLGLKKKTNTLKLLYRQHKSLTTIPIM